jgi:hypothetical protein
LLLHRLLSHRRLAYSVYFTDFHPFFLFFQATAAQLVDEIIFLKMTGTRDEVKPGDLGSNSGTRSFGPGIFFPSFTPDEIQNRNQNLNLNLNQVQNHEFSLSRGYPYPIQESMYNARGNAVPTANSTGGGSGIGVGIGIINGGGTVRSIDGTFAVRTSHGKVFSAYSPAISALIWSYCLVTCCDVV